jgi:hypothetical protein
LLPIQLAGDAFTWVGLALLFYQFGSGRNIAVEKLEKLMSYNDRLPADEILKRWK